jgi:hypothetical protein
LFSFSMIITITTSSHIWCINFVVLFGNFVTLNFLLSQLFECKLSSIFEIGQMILPCDKENGIDKKTTTCYGSSLTRS